MFGDRSSASFDFESIRHSLETCDTSSLSGLYADDAELQLVDNTRPPSRPTLFRGRSEIKSYLDDVCSRKMREHRVESEVVGQNRLSYQEACRYEDGMRVLTANTLDLDGGKIKRHTVIQAWDQ